MAKENNSGNSSRYLNTILPICAQIFSAPFAVPFFQAVARSAEGERAKGIFASYVKNPGRAFTGVSMLAPRLGLSSFRVPVCGAVIENTKGGDLDDNARVGLAALAGGAAETCTAGVVEVKEIGRYLGKNTSVSLLPLCFILFRNSAVTVTVARSMMRTQNGVSGNSSGEKHSPAANIACTAKEGFIAGAITAPLQSFVTRSTAGHPLREIAGMIWQDVSTKQGAARIIERSGFRGGGVAAVSACVASAVEASRYINSQKTEEGLGI